MLLALVVGHGGLYKERAHHTGAFTLALPVGRLHPVGARALTGLSGVALLAALPAILVPSLSSLVGQTYAWSQALQFLALWVAIGWAVFAAFFLASCLFANEYTALTASILAFFSTRQ